MLSQLYLINHEEQLQRGVGLDICGYQKGGGGGEEKEEEEENKEGRGGREGGWKVKLKYCYKYGGGGRVSRVDLKILSLSRVVLTVTDLSRKNYCNS